MERHCVGAAGIESLALPRIAGAAADETVLGAVERVAGAAMGHIEAAPVIIKIIDFSDPTRSGDG